MKMRMVVATRNGVEKLRIPAEERNGILRNRENILINADLIPPGQKDRVATAIKAKKNDQKIALYISV